jgi:hypothetical protein
MLKLIYEHLQFLKIFRKLYPLTPLKRRVRSFEREGERGIGVEGMKIREEVLREGRERKKTRMGKQEGERQRLGRMERGEEMGRIRFQGNRNPFSNSGDATDERR